MNSSVRLVSAHEMNCEESSFFELVPHWPQVELWQHLLLETLAVSHDAQTHGVSTDGHPSLFNLSVTKNVLSAVLATGLFSYMVKGIRAHVLW